MGKIFPEKQEIGLLMHKAENRNQKGERTEIFWTEIFSRKEGIQNREGETFAEKQELRLLFYKDILSIWQRNQFQETITSLNSDLHVLLWRVLKLALQTPDCEFQMVEQH